MNFCRRKFLRDAGVRPPALADAILLREDLARQLRLTSRRVRDRLDTRHTS